MRILVELVKRDCKLFFKDKGMFFTSLITPIILLVLYVTFLGRVYKNTFLELVTEGVVLDETLLNGAVGGQLISSLLAVCCVTVAFCSNLLMVQDRVSGARRDLTVSPVSLSVLSVSYFVSSAAVTVIICLAALALGIVYLAFTGWYLSVLDVLLTVCDVLLLVLFGTALSSIVNCRLSTNGQASAVGTVVSSGYGFICGAYMPISNFGDTLQRILSFLPGTYGTSLLRNHMLRGVSVKMAENGVPTDAVNAIRASLDCELYFFDRSVSVSTMYVILVLSVVLLTLIYVMMNTSRGKRRAKACKM